MESASWVLTYNGEIYNHQDLRIELLALGCSFQGHGDSETLVSALETWGLDDTVARLNGMFAFGAWHKPTQTLHLVRDRLGIKPLCYFDEYKSLVFASNPAAIVRAVRREWSVNPHAVANYLHLGAPLGEQTLVEGIRRLEPATILTWKKGHTHKRRYWRPRPRNEPIDELLEDAIRIRHQSDVPLALLMSGGVDSSLIAKHSPGARGIHLDSGMETTHAQIAAIAFGQHMTVVTPTVDDVDTLLGEYVSFCGEPSMASAAPALVGRAMQGEAKVCLSANGADELFLGYWRTIHEHQHWHIFRNHVEFGPGYDFDLDLDSLDIPLLEGFAPDTLANRQWFELNTYIRYDLNPVLDYGTMMSSIEARVPFLDHRVVERALSMPVNEKIDPALGDVEKGRKAPLKKLLMDHRQIWDRRKIGFSLPKRIFRSAKREQRIRSMIEKGIVTSLDCAGPFADRDRIYLRNSLWSLGCWFEHWVDGGIVRASIGEG